MDQIWLAPIVISCMICGYMINEFVRYVEWKKAEEKVEAERELQGNK